MHAVIGIDLGTTSIKSILFSKQGDILQTEKTATPISSDRYGSIYRAADIWAAVKLQLEKLLSCQDTAPKEAAKAPAGAGSQAGPAACGGIRIDGIAVTGMAEAGLILNRQEGREVTDILPWFERRTMRLSQRVSMAEDARNFAKTGLHNSFKYGIYKFLWLLEESGTKRSDTVWLSVCDYIVYKLTGQLVTEPGFAARTYVYDIVNHRWDSERIRSYGLSEKNFPAVVPSGKIVGSFRADGKEIPVALAGHDHVCAAFGLLYDAPDGICDSAGTSETYIGRLRALPKGGFDPKTGILYGPFVDGGWFYMANVPSSGHSVEWYRKKLQLEEFSYEAMNRALLKMEGGPTGLLYFPYLTGMGSPWYQSSMRGALLGLQENTDGRTVLKAILEGIQYQAAWVLSILEKEHDIGKKDLVCAGGSANNRAMMQIKADILQRSVRISKAQEATLAGAAALFYQKSAGEKTARAFLERALPGKESVEPNPEQAKHYEEILRKKYLPMANMLKNFYEDA